jgi:hypothetical protein
MAIEPDRSESRPESCPENSFTECLESVSYDRAPTAEEIAALDREFEEDDGSDEESDE